MEQERTAEDVWAECNKVGEHSIRHQLLNNKLAPEYRAHAVAWLANVDRADDKTFQAEQLQAVLATREAAEAARQMAHEAIRHSKLASALAVVAIILAAAAITAWAIQLLA